MVANNYFVEWLKSLLIEQAGGVFDLRWGELEPIIHYLINQDITT